VVVRIKLAVRNYALELSVWLCLALRGVGKNRICKIMFIVRHMNVINGTENKRA
jgi:hypothetical protein